MDTEKRKSSPVRAARYSSPSHYYLCQVFPLYDETGYPVVQAMVKDGLILGREAQLDDRRLRLFDRLVSKTHCRLTLTPGGLALEDLNSTNGTFVNGRAVKRAMVRAQDVLRVGDALFVVVEDVPGSESPAGFRDLVACSPAMLRTLERVATIAATNRPVLVLGGTGTGKGVLVEQLHALSGRTGPLVTVNCATLQEALVETTLFGSIAGAFTGARASRGLVARAHRGTLFLDELGELPQGLQAKLLHFIETGEVMPVGETRPQRVDVRVATATHRVIDSLRPDLLARLEDEVLTLPPLAERREEIVPVICHELKRAGIAPGKALSADSVEVALTADWPRNVRQLVKAVRRAVAGGEAGSILAPGAFMDTITEATPEVAFRTAATADPIPTPAAIRRMLKTTRGNVAEAARRFNCHRRQLYRWMARYGIRRSSTR